MQNQQLWPQALVVLATGSDRKLTRATRPSIEPYGVKGRHGYSEKRFLFGNK
jgi:hypothetical protein